MIAVGIFIGLAVLFHALTASHWNRKHYEHRIRWDNDWYALQANNRREEIENLHNVVIKLSNEIKVYKDKEAAQPRADTSAHDS